MSPEVARPAREVVSFVRRGSRLSPSRQLAWDRLAEDYVLDLARGARDTLPADGESIDPESIFGRRAPLVVEIGSGLGENIAAAASSHPDRDHLAFEVYAPGIAQTLDRIEKAGRPRNLRLVPLDALHSLSPLLPPGSLHEVWIYFPDPWHKTRHHKRRIVNAPLLANLHPLMAPGGILRLATDWAQYAHHMRRVLDDDARWQNLHPDGPRPPGGTSDEVPEDLEDTGWAPRYGGRVRTSFERKAEEAGRLVWDLAFQVRAQDAQTAPDESDRS